MVRACVRVYMSHRCCCRRCHCHCCAAFAVSVERGGARGGSERRLQCPPGATGHGAHRFKHMQQMQAKRRYEHGHTEGTIWEGDRRAEGDGRRAARCVTCSSHTHIAVAPVRIFHRFMCPSGLGCPGKPVKQWGRLWVTTGAVAVRPAPRSVCPARLCPGCGLDRVCIRLWASNSICTSFGSCSWMAVPSCKKAGAMKRSDRRCCLSPFRLPSPLPVLPFPRRHHQMLFTQMHPHLPLRMCAPVQLRIRGQLCRRVLRATCAPQGRASGRRPGPSPHQPHAPHATHSSRFNVHVACLFFVVHAVMCLSTDGFFIC